MRKILLNVAVSLDGFIEGPAGEYDWCFTDQDYGMTEFIDRTETILFGRKSYEVLMQADKNAWASHARIVFSTTMNNIEGASIVKADIEEFVTTMKQQPGKDIWLFGGAVLTESLMRYGLVDEMHLSIHPILLGQGKPLFSNGMARTKLALIKNKSYSSGLVQAIYALPQPSSAK